MLTRANGEEGPQGRQKSPALVLASLPKPRILIVVSLAKGMASKLNMREHYH